VGQTSSQTTAAKERFLRALLVEDNEADAAMCVRSLRMEGFHVIPDVVQTPEAFAERLNSNTYDIILADYGLPGWTGIGALATLQQSGKDIPFILISGTVGEDIAVECIKKGAADYVLKERLIRLPLVVRRALEEQALRKQQKRSEEELRDSEERYRELFENANDIVFTLDLDANLTSFNKAGERITGYTREELFQKGLSVVLEPEQFERMREMLKRRMASETATTHEIELLAKDGRGLVLEINSRLIYHNGIPLGMQGIARDITERRKALQERERLISELREALAKVKTLSGMLPICAWCKKIRDDHGYWKQIEVYIEQHSEAEFTHGVCPECAKRIYPDLKQFPPDDPPSFR